MKSIILSAILISTALPAAAQRVVRPVVEYERLEDVEALLRKMNATAFDRHDCGAFPDYPDEFEPYRLRRFSRKSDNWHECLNDHANDMARSARNTSTRLDVMMEDVPDDHPIRPRMARAVKIYNRLAAEALSNIEDAFDDA
ncbi:MAG: hypothetical protein KAI28_00075, partial [Sphingomonadales bacterium]|nr:hypothetical protein [Sphingomonadales bacterium]